MIEERLGRAGVPRDCNRATPATLNVTRDFEKCGKPGMRSREGPQQLVAGSTVYQPPGIKHKEIDHSEDSKCLEITMPADFETKEVK
ncbi:MAG TPA: hypothetical protein VI232_26855 [Reyranella sp.]